MGVLGRLKKRNRLSVEEAEDLLKAAYHDELEVNDATFSRWHEALHGGERADVAREANDFHHDLYRRTTDRHLPDPDIPRELQGLLGGMRRDVAFFESADTQRIESELKELLAQRAGVSVEEMKAAGEGQFWEHYASEFLQHLRELESEAGTGRLPRRVIAERLASLTSSYGDAEEKARVKTPRFNELMRAAIELRSVLERMAKQ